MPLPLLGAAAIGAGGSIIGGALGALGQSSANRTNIRLQREQNEWNERQAEKANKWNLEQWERENLYNSPMQQMQRLEQAGLNPNLMYGQGNPGSASSLKSEMPSSVAPARVNNSMQYLGNVIAPAISMYQDMRLKNNQISAQEKQIQLLDEEIAGKALDNINKGYINNINYSKSKYAEGHSDLDYQLKQIRYDSSAQRLAVDRMNADILKKTSPSLIEKAYWVARDAKQRALGGELDIELNRQLKPFGMTSKDDLWQRKIVPVVEQMLMLMISGKRQNFNSHLIK